MAAHYKNFRRRNTNEHYINQYIRAPKVRLISNDGENVGVVDTKEALRKAKEEELDLVLIAEKANPPVAKILDYSKFLYEENKKKSSSKAKSSKSETKELIFGPNIGNGDLQVRVDRTKEFIEEGHRVKMTVRLRGREKAHPDIGMEKINSAVEMLAGVAEPEKKPELKNYMISVTFKKK